MNAPGIQLYGLVLGIVISASLHLWAHRGLDRRGRFDVVTMYTIGILGTHGFTSFIVHTVFAGQAASSIGWAAGATRLVDIVRTGNMAVKNADPVRYWDFLVPVVLVVLFALRAGRRIVSRPVPPLATSRASI